jgi:hypothetical protein
VGHDAARHLTGAVLARRFRRNRQGRLVVRLTTEEVALLRRLPVDLKTLVAGGDPEDPVLQRLFPHAYLDPTEEDAETDWQRLVHDDLVAERLAALSLLETALARATPGRGSWVEAELTAEEESAWLGVLNDARLALGTRLGVTEEMDLRHLDADDPEVAAFALYDWLTVLQGQLIEALTG